MIIETCVCVVRDELDCQDGRSCKRLKLGREYWGNLLAIFSSREYLPILAYLYLRDWSFPAGRLPVAGIRDGAERVRVCVELEREEEGRGRLSET